MGASQSKVNNIRSSEGSIAMCAVCPTAHNCCSRVNAPQGVDAPIVFPVEVDAISQATSLLPAEFATPDDSSSYSWLQSTQDGCVFLRLGRCQVYDVRPLDCRLFPLDLVELRNGQIAWIAYTSICPTSYDPEPLLRNAKALLQNSPIDMSAYARARIPLLEEHAFRVLELVGP